MCENEGSCGSILEQCVLLATLHELASIVDLEIRRSFGAAQMFGSMPSVFVIPQRSNFLSFSKDTLLRSRACCTHHCPS